MPPRPTSPLRSAAFLCAWIVAAACPLGMTAAQGAELNDETFQSWKILIEPCAEELTWTRIPWRTSVQAGLDEANESGRPLLLWIMNGHPLGCT